MAATHVNPCGPLPPTHGGPFVASKSEIPAKPSADPSSHWRSAFPSAARESPLRAVFLAGTLGPVSPLLSLSAPHCQGGGGPDVGSRRAGLPPSTAFRRDLRYSEGYLEFDAGIVSCEVRSATLRRWDRSGNRRRIFHLQKDRQFLDKVADVLYMFTYAVLKERAECPFPPKPFRLPPLATYRSGHGAPGQGRAARADCRSLQPRHLGRLASRRGRA